MELTLDDEVPLFRHLAELARRAADDGVELRLVGGAAMLLWGRHLDRPREMTQDLDCALLDRDLPDEETALVLTRRLASLLQKQAFSRDEKNWKGSRKARFSYSHATDPVSVDILCGNLSVGRSSKRRPAWEIAPPSTGPIPFYAAHTPWLDRVENWIAVQVTSGTILTSLRIPDLSGLLALKLRATQDKIDILSAPHGYTEHEHLRLARHGQDSSSLLDWIEEEAEIPALMSLAGKFPDIREVALKIVRWFLDHMDLAGELGLHKLADKIDQRLL